MSFSKRFQDLLKELVDLLGEDEVREVEVERRLLWGWRIRVSKGGGQVAYIPVASDAARADGPAPLEGSGDSTDELPDGLHRVTSPLVGMFYGAPSPDAQPFVREGDVVSQGQTLCIIEAMKIMNEIEADTGGRVARILVENGTPVEYNTPLFLLEPL